jgi:hypothetical protein
VDDVLVEDFVVQGASHRFLLRCSPVRVHSDEFQILVIHRSARDLVREQPRGRGQRVEVARDEA